MGNSLDKKERQQMDKEAQRMNLEIEENAGVDRNAGGVMTDHLM